jgi:hypothetical protein
VGLIYVRSIVQSEEAQPFDRLVEAGVNEVTGLLVGGGIIDSRAK